MKIEIRNDSTVIDGYVNAVERESRLIMDVQGNFKEKIKAGTFEKALKRAENVRMLLNHDKDRVLANTKDGTLELYEDSIGLRARATITDSEVMEKAKKGELRGWSFGFIAHADEWEKRDNAPSIRTLTDIELTEVSLIDNTRLPAYVGTSVETRDGKDVLNEVREMDRCKVYTSDFSEIRTTDNPDDNNDNDLNKFKERLEKLKKHKN